MRNKNAFPPFREDRAVSTKQYILIKCDGRDLPGGSVVKNPPSNAGDSGLIPGPGTKIPDASGQLSPFSSVQFSHSVESDSLQPHGLQLSRLPCPSPTPNSRSLLKLISIELVMPFNHLILCRLHLKWIMNNTINCIKKRGKKNHRQVLKHFPLWE